MHCKAPIKGLTINVNGRIRMCCTDDETLHMNVPISEVDDLYEFFHSNYMFKIRQTMEKQGLDYPACWMCKTTTAREVMSSYNERFQPHDNTVALEYLELSASNTCTQSCVMCIPKFSSSLTKLHHKNDKILDAKNWQASEEDIQKILKILPKIKILFLKGGEPFADKNNLRFLQNIPSIRRLRISSNGHNVPDEFISALKIIKYSPTQPKIGMTFSVDGSDKIYEWVRGDDYEEVMWNIQSFYEKTRIEYNVYQSLTAFTLPSYIEDTEKHQSMYGCRSVDYENIVEEYSSPRMYPQHYLDKFDLKLKTYSDEYKRELAPKWKWKIDMFNAHRGFDIRDHVPELEMIEKELERVK